jgi:hypothetical protein
MTHCTGTLADRCLEQYIQGTLPDLEAREFEEHYFDCPACLAQVEALQTVALKLASQPRKATRTLIPWPLRVSVLGAIAATLLIGFFSIKGLRRPDGPAIATAPPAPVPATGPASQPAPKPSMASSAVSRLADLTLPAFQAPNLRGQSGDPNFTQGMKAYSSQNCAQAVQSLSQVPVEDEDALAAHFYIGVCQMHLGNLPEARADLTRIADAGDSPQQEAALYYLAQTALQNNDPKQAHHFLTRTISLHGDFERRAKAELTQINEVQPHQ